MATTRGSSEGGDAVTDAKKREFWDERAAKASHPGTDDFILKRLEVDLILRVIGPGSSVLDVGCGDGETLVALAEQRGCTGVGVDFAEQMVAAANARAGASTAAGRLRFQRGELPSLPADLGRFDYVLTERCLINVTADQQRAAFDALIEHVRPGGQYLMIESFRQGLDRSNALRAALGLDPIAPPWHNAFLDEDAVATWGGRAVLKQRLPFTSTYHFLSRVIYARLATDRGEQMRYDSDINLLSLRLPPFGDCGPVQLWTWERPGGREVG